MIPLSDRLRALVTQLLRCAPEDVNELLDALVHFRTLKQKSGSFTVGLNENNTYFILTSAATVTLPEIPIDGFVIRVIQSADANFVLQGNANILHRGNNVANTITFNTVSQKLGSIVEVEAITVGGLRKWLVTNLGGTTAVVA